MVELKNYKNFQSELLSYIFNEQFALTRKNLGDIEVVSEKVLKIYKCIWGILL